MKNKFRFVIFFLAPLFPWLAAPRSEAEKESQSALLPCVLAANLAFGPLQDAGATPSGEARVPKEKSPLLVPTDADIFHTRIFLEPLVPIGGKTSAAENAALAEALHSYGKRNERDDDHAIQEFLAAFPKSVWRAAVLTNLGLEYRQTGWFLKALATWEEAWNLSKNEKSRAGKAMADCAIGELAELNARLGRRGPVEAILKEIKDRPLIGAATEKVTAAREGAWAMRHEPGTAFKCGPFALARIQASGRFNIPLDPKIIAVQSTDHGMSLDQVWELSRSLGLDYQMAKRAPGSEIVVPSVVNWKASHYAALLREENGKFLVQDPTFGPDIWVSKAALDAEGSGYFLVPHGPLAKGWQQVKADEARTVWGRGTTGEHDPSGTKCIDDKAKCNQGNCGMARYNFHTQVVSLNITDTPVGYTPPRGPDMHLTLTYNQRELNIQGYTNIPNFGSKWVCNWTAYIDDVSYNSDPFTVHLPSGGSEWFYLYYGVTTGFQSGAVMTRDVDSPPPAILYYKRTLPDGSQQVFDLHSGNVGARRFYMTKLIDPAGQVARFNYDEQHFRLTSVTDALGQTFTISYLSNNPSTLPDYYLISRVEDFAQRAATFEYQNGQLWKIHDAIGITSEFHYASGTDFINEMITPYGTTTFSHPDSSLDTDPNHPGNARVIQAIAPDGIERVEYGHNAPGISPTEILPLDIYILNGLYHYRNSYYWDKKAMAMYPPDGDGVPQFSKAKIIHWLHLNDGSGNTVSNIKEREKQPLENAVYYFYPGQNGSNGPVFTGSHGFPSVVARRLDDGTGPPQTQSYRYEYNTLRNLKKMTDPAGRVTSYVYAPNEIDVIEIYQRNPNGVSFDPDGLPADKIASSTYNAQHQPLTSTDAAGQTTIYTYNTDGQVWTIQNANGETTTYSYGDGSSGPPLGYLTSITSPPFGDSSAVTTFDYDSSNRVRVVTSYPDAYQVTTDYDNLDRPTQITYPDGTNQQFQYTDTVRGMTLDLTASRDRLGRWTYRHYNANRQMDSITDPETRTTVYGWCSCGSVETITDPRGKITVFNRDLQGRVYQKVFADNTSIDYLYEGQTGPNTPGATSRLKSSLDAESQRTNYLYFADDTVRQISYTDNAGQPLNPPTPSVNYTYDPNYNRVASMIDGVGTTIYAYNSITVPPALGAGRLASIDGALANDTITFGYDQLGRITNRSINGIANSDTWNYDSLGRVSSEVNKLGIFTNTYVGVTNRLSQIAYPGSASVKYIYFPNAQDRRLQQIKNLGSSNNKKNLISQFDYTYDAEGEIATWTKNYPGLAAPQRFDLGYDNADQLLTAPLKNASTNALIKQYTYGYDLGSNRTSELVGTVTTTSTPNDVNEITSQTGGVNRTLTYDLNGNITNDGSTRTFEWDGGNRLVAVNYTGTTNRSEFSYDGLSRVAKIVEKTAGNITSTRKIVWSGMEKCEFRDAADAVTLRVYPQGQHDGTAAYFFTRDHLGSIREMLNSSATVVARNDYDPYGRSTSGIGLGPPFDFNFTGMYRHAKSNLDLAVYRAYDPDLGRWLSRDPIAELGGLNLYGYVSNGPTNSIDPSGLTKIYGHWCGPDWTGGRNESYTPHPPGYYRAPLDALDAACENHDICYYQCRRNFPCDADRRSICFRDCDRTLANGADLIGGFWGRTITLAIDRPGKRNPERNDPSCCQTGK